MHLCLVPGCVYCCGRLATSSVSTLAQGTFLLHLRFGTGYVMAIIAVFGSLLTPDVIVWQTARKRESGARFHTQESRFGCSVAVLISRSAIIASSRMHVADPASMTTAQAAQALAPLTVPAGATNGSSWTTGSQCIS